MITRALVVVLLTGLAACAEPEPVPLPAAPVNSAPPASSRSAAPKPTIDVRLGRETAFGLQLPRGARARTNTPASRSFSVPLERTKAVAFLRDRLGDVTVDEAALHTTLAGTVLAAHPRAHVIVVVRQATLTSEVLIRLEDPGND